MFLNDARSNWSGPIYLVAAVGERLQPPQSLDIERAFVFGQKHAVGGNIDRRYRRE